MSSAEHVVVTGGTGFVGACLVEKLLAAGYAVTIVDRVTPEQAPRLNGLREHPGLRAVRHDFGSGEARDDLDAAVAEATIVYHLAGNTENRSAHAHHHADLDITVNGTVSLLDSVVRGGAAPVVVFTSSQLVYDPAGATTDARPPLRPRSLFGAGKLAAEAFVSAYAHEFGFRARACRLSNVIGSSFRRGIVHDLVRRLLDDPRQLHVLGDGSQRRSFLAVDDCARALMMAAHDASAESAAPMAAFDVSNIDTTSAVEVAGAVAAECPVGKPELTIEGNSTAWRGDVGSLHVPPHALLTRGWAPRLNSGEAVRVTARELFRDLSREDNDE